MNTVLNNKQGFTLLEVIITFIVAAILGTIFLQVMGTSMQQSYEPVSMVQNGFSVNEIMEKMNADYRNRLITSTSNPLADFKSDVENGNVIANTPYFGDYTYQTQYIKFIGGNEVADASADPRILKITITHGGQRLSAIFTK
jgi:prepilin-type N-terminal cleavage/methylation domain-containing protein